LARLAQARRVLRAPGVTNISTFTNPQNPNQVALTSDLDALTAALQSPEAPEAMQHDSVVLLVES